ncbi:MAG: HNH endonuclease [Bacillota bacterium]
MRKKVCELCGGRAEGEPHHIRPRSLGGPDIRENLIQLCFECHRKAQDGLIHREKLFQIVAAREGTTLVEVHEAVGLPRPEPQTEVSTPPAPPQGVTGHSVDELVQRYLNLVEGEDASKWERGAILVVILDGMKMKPPGVAGLVGCSPAQVRELAKTYRAFPEEADRAKDLSWFHHRLAANTTEPKAWIEKAVASGWSTRQMRESIKAASAKSDEAIKDMALAKAEKALALAKETLAAGGEAGAWLRRELSRLLRESREPEETQEPDPEEIPW